MKIIGSDLIGPLVESPTSNKTNKNIRNAFSNGFIARQGVTKGNRRGETYAQT